MKPIINHYKNIMDDIGKRLRICKYAGVITGSSGGSRRADRMGQTYNQFFGGVLHSAATGTSYKKSRHMFSATVLGDHDYNIGEMNKVWLAFKKKGYYRWSPQGHGWYPNDMGRRAFDWLCVQILQRKKSPVPAAAANEMLKALIKQADSQSELSEQLTYRNWIIAVAKARADLMKNADIKSAIAKNKQALADLLKQKDGKKNLKSLVEWEKFHQKEMIQNFCKSWNFMSSMQGAKNKKLVVAKTAKTRAKILKNLDKFIKKYKDTEGARLAQECKEQLEKFDANWA